MTSASLKEKPVRDLARLAKQHGVAGWHAMRKDQLIRALVRKAKAARRRDPAVGSPSEQGRGAEPRQAAVDQAQSPVRARSAAVAQRIQEARERLATARRTSPRRPRGAAAAVRSAIGWW